MELPEQEWNSYEGEKLQLELRGHGYLQTIYIAIFVGSLFVCSLYSFFLQNLL